MNKNSELTKDKGLRLINYLKEYTRLRAKIITDYQNYEQVFWLSEIPKDEKYYYSQLWSGSGEHDPDVWFEVRKYDEPILERPPKKFIDWYEPSDLENDKNPPLLKSSTEVLKEVGNPDYDPDDNASPKYIKVKEVLYIKDYPNIRPSWETYIEEKWKPWSEAHNKWLKNKSVYSQLFAIHAKQEKLGEEYELVLGLGLLQWKPPHGATVKRHLLVCSVNLIFEPHIGKFTLSPFIDGANLRLELDMLEIEDQPINAKKIAEESLKSADDNPWDTTSVDACLMGLANILSDQGMGRYEADNHEPDFGAGTERPLIRVAPALVLRKRSVKGLMEILLDMGKYLEEGGKLPEQFGKLCEEFGSAGQFDANDSDQGHEMGPNHQLPDFIYFVKHANYEQLEILKRLLRDSGVLVQGPPGTGKSHTIANLISHYLAIGMRVLVTAKTPRALKVLHDYLPDQIKPLCISMLGYGIEEHKMLEASVSKILAQQDQWDKTVSKNKIKSLKDSIERHKEEKAKIENRIRAIRERETYKHSGIAGKYSGTTASMVKYLNKTRDELGWIPDDIDSDTEIPVNVNDALKASLIYLKMSKEKIIELGKNLPNEESELVSPDEISKKLRELNAAEDINLNAKWALGEIKPHEMASKQMIDSFKNAAEKITVLVNKAENILRRPMPWIESAVEDMLADKDTPWKERHRAISDSLEGLKERARALDNRKLKFPQGIDLIKIYADTEDLAQYLQTGGKLGWGPFRSKTVRERKYILCDVYINGQRCDSPQKISILRDCLEVKVKLAYCWNLWDGFTKTNVESDSILMQVSELEELQEALTSVVSLYHNMEETKEAVARVKGISEPQWHDLSEVKNFKTFIAGVYAKCNGEVVKKELEDYEGRLKVVGSIRNVHPVVGNLAAALNKKQADSYAKYYNEIIELKEQAQKLEKINSILNKLAKAAPILVEHLKSGNESHIWQSRIQKLEKAWDRTRLETWIRDYLEEEDIHSLELKAENLGNKIRNEISQLAATLAWENCFERMTDGHRSSLIGWQQAMKKGGKFTGKHAPKHRRVAKGHLNKSKDAVPAWIMPLHRVYDTIKASPGLFDVIILDEASQCGNEAIPLSFLATKLLIVGDNQQISPESVGVNRSQAQRLIDEYLFDFEHKDNYDPDSSFFDQCKRHFSRSVTLREHFRCMPEIIRFSNDLCYTATPLIPLRQYPPNRLEPLKHVYLDSGFREGDGARSVNIPEAKALVKQLVKCCDDPSYEGRSMGVIVLQGEAQAKAIEDMLLEELGAEEMETRGIICGNPYSFQGDERDVIFLSMVAAPNTRIGPYTKQPDVRRFNVAASRAKDQMWLFHSVTKSDLSKQCLRYRLIDYFENPRRQVSEALGHDLDELRKRAKYDKREIGSQPSPFESWFEVDVALEIASRGYRVVPQFPAIENKRIDLVIEGEIEKLAVECDGDHWHGLDNREEDDQRQRVLVRAGWRFERIGESQFYYSKEKALEPIWHQLDLLGIRPVYATDFEDEPSQRSSQESKENYSGSSQDKHGMAQNGVEQGEKKESDETVETSCVLSIEQALKLNYKTIESLIINILKELPNNSCKKDALPTYILKHLDLVTRGKPRLKFEGKVKRVLSKMAEDWKIEIYKSKNTRVRLIKEDIKGSLNL